MTLSKRQSNWMTELQKLGASPIMYWRDVQFSVRREAESVLTKVEAEGRDLSPGEQRWIEGSHADLAFIDQKIQEQEVILEKERQEAASHVTGPLSAYPEGQTIISGVSPTDLGDKDRLLMLRELQREPFKGRSYGDLFGSPRGNNGFASANEFLTLVHSGLYDPRLWATMQESGSSTGGFMVPEEHSSLFWDRSLQREIIRPRAFVTPMATDVKKIAMLQDDDHSTNGPYDLGIVWSSEGTAPTEREAKVRMVELRTKKGIILVPISNELLEDSPIGTQMEMAMTGSMSNGLDEVFIKGDGVGKPQGILNSPSLITITKEVGQLSATLLYENLIRAYARMLPSCIPTSIWMANPSTIPQLLQLQVGTGASNTWRPVLNESNGAFSILGRPLFLTSACAALGTVGDLIFVCPDLYVIGIRKEIEIARSEHVAFKSDITYMRARIRLSAQGLMDKIFTPLDGGDTLSWAVVIATRS